ncbi:exopolygalacturonase [Manihot esculenta]|uniref:exopolygalacturonase n=1 Tax=Manihot esculenta TaxID=3983 RepID=UPI000B5D6EFB|nr:exopolygalacturonase [Manihot esculenta]
MPRTTGLVLHTLIDSHYPVVEPSTDKDKLLGSKIIAVEIQNARDFQFSRFDFITNSVVHDVTSLDSKNLHVNVLGSKNLTFDRFTITAPGHSINTDGTHIRHSNGINIINLNIATGNYCISISDGSEQIRITNVRCGHGHGISMKSLGKTTDKFVSEIFVRKCTIYDTDNGVRIKTWPALHGGMASDMHFEDIMMKNVCNPIVIDQLPSKVKIANVTFKNIRGSSATAIAIRINCSSSFPCEKVKLTDINLTYRGKEGPAKSLCANVKPTLKGKLTPTMC